MDAGSLDRRIRIERPIEIDDGRQSRPGSWEEVATVWARYIPAKGQEAREAMGREALSMASFQLRWSRSVAGVDPSHRLIFENRAYDIKSAVEIGRRDGIELQCAAGDDHAV